MVTLVRRYPLARGEGAVSGSVIVATLKDEEECKMDFETGSYSQVGDVLLNTVHCLFEFLDDTCLLRIEFVSPDSCSYVHGIQWQPCI